MCPNSRTTSVCMCVGTKCVAQRNENNNGKKDNHVLTCHLIAIAHMQTHKQARTYQLRGVNRGV